MGTFVPDEESFSSTVHYKNISLPNGMTKPKFMKEDMFSCEFTTDPPSNVSSYDVELDSDGQPTGERWPPLGAPNDDNVSLYSFSELGRRSCASGADLDRLKELEYEQEELNCSLFALSTHFAQVQFRLKQIVEAAPSEKEDLLKELEAFANRGIPDVRKSVNLSEFEEKDHELRLDMGQERQKELIEQLKQQLEDLENYAYQTGEADLPQATVLKKQKAILDQLKGNLNLNMDLDHLSMDDLRQQVDHAVKEVMKPYPRGRQGVNVMVTSNLSYLDRCIRIIPLLVDDKGSIEETLDNKLEGTLKT